MVCEAMVCEQAIIARGGPRLPRVLTRPVELYALGVELNTADTLLVGRTDV